jgi:type I restriction enzyme S subunit
MAGDGFRRTTFARLISEGALEIGDGYRAKNEELGGDGLLFLRAGHVTDTHIDFDGVERFHATLEPRVRSKMAKPGDAVITTKGNSTGRTTFVTPSMPPFVYSPHLSYWRSLDPSRVEGGFLRYWSKGPEFTEQLAGMKASTDMAPYLSLIDQKRLGITLPPIGEQRAIAHILGTLDDKIELNRRMNETLETMARALFKSWFVDFDPVRAKAEGRDPGVPKPLADLFPARLVDSELGEIPEGWRVERLSDIRSGSVCLNNIPRFISGLRADC